MSSLSQPEKKTGVLKRLLSERKKMEQSGEMSDSEYLFQIKKAEENMRRCVEAAKGLDPSSAQYREAENNYNAYADQLTQLLKKRASMILAWYVKEQGKLVTTISPEHISAEDEDKYTKLMEKIDEAGLSEQLIINQQDTTEQSEFARQVAIASRRQDPHGKEPNGLD